MANGVKPDFSHLCLNDKNCLAWQAYMESHSTKLEDVLWKMGASKISWGLCLVCDKEYPANLKSHIWGKAHWAQLKQRLQWKEPASPEDLARYTQRWALAPGSNGSENPGYYFNHVTGQQGFCPAPANGAVAASVPAPAVASPAPVPAAPITPRPGLAPAMPTGDSVDGLTFPHGQDFARAINAKDQWQAFMDKASQHLEDFLHKATGHWDHSCCICGNKTMQRGAQDHIRSKNHWVTLWKKMQEIKADLPPQEVAEVMDEGRPWIQGFHTPRGTYLFNHLTGGQQLRPGAGASLPQQPAPHTKEAAVAPVARAAPPAVTASLTPAAPLQAAVAKTASGEAPDSMTYPHGQNFAVAIDSKEGWSVFMCEPARTLEKALHQATGQWEFVCCVCEKPMANGASEHIQGRSHWTTLWKKLQAMSKSLPPQEIAEERGRAWVQTFEIPGGRYVFNHLTGGQEQDTSADGVAPPQQHAARPIAPPAAQPEGPAMDAHPLADRRNLSVRRARSNPAVMAATSGGQTPRQTTAPVGAAGPSRCGTLEHWHWRCVVAKPAAELNAALERPFSSWGEDVAPMVRNCCVCSTMFRGVEDHLASENHWKSLRTMLAEGAASEQYNFSEAFVGRRDQPWVQDFGDGVIFNHATLQTQTVLSC